MTTTALIILIIVVAIVAAAAGVLGYRLMAKRRTERLREQFGPEYDRSVRQSDDQSAAESELRAREKRHRELELRPLDEGQQRKFEQRWSSIQADFVDSPNRAARDADELVADVMSARGYPADEFDQRAEDLSVTHPRLTQRYREARRISVANAEGNATTEDLRHAVTTYRSLVESLLHEDASKERGDASSTEQGDVPSTQHEEDDAAARHQQDRDARTPDREGNSNPTPQQDESPAQRRTDSDGAAPRQDDHSEREAQR